MELFVAILIATRLYREVRNRCPLIKKRFERFLFRDIVDDVIALRQKQRIKFGIVVVPVRPQLKRHDAVRVFHIRARVLGERTRKAPRLFDIESIGEKLNSRMRDNLEDPALRPVVRSERHFFYPC